MPDPWAPYQQNFFNQMWPLAQSASQRTGVPAQVIFAQSALETGWGRQAPQNNYFGIKGPGGSQQTREYIGGRWVTVNDSFRGYGSMAESVDGYVSFITNPNSRRWGAARNASSPEEAARAIAAGGYATDPNYAGKLMSIIRSIPNPFQFGATTPNQSVAGDPNWIERASGLDLEFSWGTVWDRLTGRNGASIGDAVDVAGAVTSGAAQNTTEGTVTRIMASLEDPVKRTGFVVIGLLLFAIAIYVILNGGKSTLTALDQVVEQTRATAKRAAAEAVAA